MGNNFQFLEIIFFAMVAIFIILRLRNVLGRRTGNEPTNTNNFKDHKSSKSNDVNNVVSIGENNFDEKSSKPKNKDPDIYEIDPTFDEGEDRFISEVGILDGQQNLVLVGKLSRPIKISNSSTASIELTIDF